MGSDLPTLPVPHDSLLRVRKLAKRYVRGNLWGRRVAVVAVNGVDLEIPRGQTLALVGESGSGKSTVARCVARLEKPDSGQIWIGEKNASDLSSNSRLPLGREVQMVFQDPVTSMNPRFTAAEVVEEPLLIQGLNRDQRRKVALESIDEVGLSRAWADRSAMQFSGGQRQRLAIARALVLRPKLLVLDEAITGLDLSTQAQIANLLLALQTSHSFTYLLISHDLALVARMADAIAVMAGGRIVETGPTSQMMTAPKEEETIRLLASARAAQSRLDTLSEASA
jgi:ABC-type glutathione transport system ATPase component